MVFSKRVLNLGAQQIRVVANMLSGLMVTRLIIQHLGAGIYANIGVMLAVIAFVGIMVNAYSGAAARFITQSIARDNMHEASNYLSNSILAVLVIVSAISVPLLLIQASRVGTFGELSAGMMLLFVVGTLFNGLAGVFRSINFATECLVSSSIIFAFSRLFYVALVFFFVVKLSVGVWGVALSYCLSGGVALLGLLMASRLILPAVRYSSANFSPNIFRQVFSYVSWSLLIYFGLFCSGPGIQIVTKNALPSHSLGLVLIVLSVQLGSIAGLFLMNLNVLTSPGIYKALAINDNESASRLVERHFFLIGIFSSLGILLFVLKGDYFLRIWLGEQVPDGIISVAVGILVAVSLNGLSVSLNAFLSGAGHVRLYGIICLIEGLLNISCVSIVLTIYGDRALYLVGWVLSAIAVFKLSFVVVIFRNILKLSSIAVYLKKGLIIGFTLLVSLGLFWLLKKLCFNNFYMEVFELTLLSIPFLILIMRYVFPRPRWGLSKRCGVIL